jgi:hypothetical protein
MPASGIAIPGSSARRRSEKRSRLVSDERRSAGCRVPPRLPQSRPAAEKALRREHLRQYLTDSDGSVVIRLSVQMHLRRPVVATHCGARCTTGRPCSDRPLLLRLQIIRRHRSVFSLQRDPVLRVMVINRHCKMCTDSNVLHR